LSRFGYCAPDTAQDLPSAEGDEKEMIHSEDVLKWKNRVKNLIYFMQGKTERIN